MYEFDFKDETFDINELNNYSLFIKISESNFAYCLFDIKRNKFTRLKSAIIQNNIETFFADDIFKQYSGKVKFVVYSTKTIIVPKAFYSLEKEANILEFNVSIDNNEEIYRNKLRNDSYNIFTINKNILALIKSNFTNFEIYNQASVIINENFVNQSKDKTTLLIESEKQFIDVSLFIKSQLIFKNTFSYKTSTDFVFFVLNIFDKFNLQPEKIELIISGIFTNESNEIIMLSNYIKKIKYAKPSLNYSYVFNDTKISKFTNLLNLIHCE
jgi:hypothetical protein